MSHRYTTILTIAFITLRCLTELSNGLEMRRVAAVVVSIMLHFGTESQFYNSVFVCWQVQFIFPNFVSTLSKLKREFLVVPASDTSAVDSNTVQLSQLFSCSLNSQGPVSNDM